MVNQDLDKFLKIQEKHKATYIGKRPTKKGVNPDPDYNNQNETDKNVGATGRDI